MAAVALLPLARRRPVIYSANNLESAFRPGRDPDWGSRPPPGGVRAAPAGVGRGDLDAEPRRPRRCAQARAGRRAALRAQRGGRGGDRPPADAGRPARGAAGGATSPTRPTARGWTSCVEDVMPRVWAGAPELRLTVAGRGYDVPAGRRPAAASARVRRQPQPALRARGVRGGAAAQRRRLAAEVHRGAGPRAAGGGHPEGRRRVDAEAGARLPRGRRRRRLRAGTPRQALDPASGAAVRRCRAGAGRAQTTRSRRWRAGCADEDRLGDDVGGARRGRVRRRAPARRRGRARPRDGAAHQPPRHRRRHARRRPARGARAQARLAHLAAAGPHLAADPAPAAPRARARGALRRAAAPLQEGAAAGPAPARRAARRGSPGPNGDRCPAPLRGGLPGRLYARAARGTAAVLAISEGTRGSLVEAGVPADRWPSCRTRSTRRASGRCRRRAPSTARALGIPRGRVRDRLPDALQRQEAQRGGRGRRRCGWRGEPGPPVHLADDRRGRDGARAARAGRPRSATPPTSCPAPAPSPPSCCPAATWSVFCPSPTEGEPLAISMGMLAERPVVATAAEGATGLDRARNRGDRCARPRRGAVAALLAAYRADPDRARRRGAAGRALAAARHDPAAIGARAAELLGAA